MNQTWRQKDIPISQRMMFLVCLLVTLLLIPMLDFADTRAIDSSGGEQLLKVIDIIALSGRPNGDEYIYHLSQLAIGRLANVAQQEKIRNFMVMVEPRIKDRDQNINKVLSQKQLSYAYKNEYKVARQLYRIAAASLLSSFIMKEDDLTFPGDLKNVISKLFPEIPLSVPGYRIQWDVVIPGEQLDLDATPLKYQDSGFRSFLLIYSKGLVYFYGGDFSGARVDINHKNKVKVDLDNFFNR